MSLEGSQKGFCGGCCNNMKIVSTRWKTRLYVVHPEIDDTGDVAVVLSKKKLGWNCSTHANTNNVAPFLVPENFVSAKMFFLTT